MSKNLILKELSRYNIGTYADVIYRNALLYPQREALLYKSKRITFSEYNSRINRLVHALTTFGVNKGDVIGVLSWNRLEYADVYGAAMKGGFIISPFNPNLKEYSLDYVINHSKANTLFVGAELIDTVNYLRSRLYRIKNYISMECDSPNYLNYEELITSRFSDEPDVQVNEDDPLMILYTSGTSGISRGALYKNSQLVGSTRSLVMLMGLRSGDRHVQIMPLFHMGGSHYFRAFLFVAGTNIIMHQRTFDAAATLRMIQDEHATDIHLMPIHLASLLKVPDPDKYDISSIKRMSYAGSVMPAEVLKRGIAAWGHVLSQNYGLTECGPDITYLDKDEHKLVEAISGEPNILVSAGRPCIGIHVRIVDESDKDVGPGVIGEVIVQSKYIMSEYWNILPNDTGRAIINGWLHTEDLGYYDEEGYIYLVGRKRDMIATGDGNVFCREVEDVLYTHPDVHEAAVIGIHDSRNLEKVHAVIVLKPNSNVAKDELIAYCKKYIAVYKAPKSIDFVRSLPRDSTGKINKRVLRTKYDKARKRKI